MQRHAIGDGVDIVSRYTLRLRNDARLCDLKAGNFACCAVGGRKRKTRCRNSVRIVERAAKAIRGERGHRFGCLTPKEERPAATAGRELSSLKRDRQASINSKPPISRNPGRNARC